MQLKMLNSLKCNKYQSPSILSKTLNAYLFALLLCHYLYLHLSIHFIFCMWIFAILKRKSSECTVWEIHTFDAIANTSSIKHFFELECVSSLVICTNSVSCNFFCRCTLMLPVVIIVSFSIQSNRRNPIAVAMHCLVIIFQVVNRNKLVGDDRFRHE